MSELLDKAIYYLTFQTGDVFENWLMERLTQKQRSELYDEINRTIRAMSVLPALRSTVMDVIVQDALKRTE